METNLPAESSMIDVPGRTLVLQFPIGREGLRRQGGMSAALWSNSRTMVLTLVRMTTLSRGILCCERNLPRMTSDSPAEYTLAVSKV